MCFARVAGLLATSLVLLFDAAFAQPKNLASYRAVYQLSLNTAREGSGISAIDGRLVLEWNEQCDGYTFAQRIRTEVDSYDRGRISSDFTISSWESRDGLRYRFSIRHHLNEQLVETFQGEGRLDGPGKGGVAEFSTPDGLTIALPRGTVFPSEHTFRLVEAARAGRSTLVVDVFDGAGDEGLSRATAVIGPAKPAPGAEGDVPPPLGDLPNWRVWLSFHDRNAGDDMLPQYEVGFRMFDNGISDNVLLSYEDFSIDGVLEELEIFPTPTC